ncbi:Leucine-rich repeats and immunoglobulin-like domains protein 2 [Larimichthys crocea]|uniref:Uncharacterized protein n=1 Tax=Larimichthys crocea TaxID=215358 RepID=A0ACD3RL72_LARCR|nr:Leucine-rich repeats and immunoglobulin-like domains protein 2 [Larimichthys crocea]
MNLPADIPSYLSSQGTLSEPQEGYSNSEAGSHQQLMPPLSNGYVHKGTDDCLRRSFWGEGEDPSSKPQPGTSQHPVTVHRPPLTSTADGADEQSEAGVDCFPRKCTQDHRSASNRTNPQEHPAPT